MPGVFAGLAGIIVIAAFLAIILFPGERLRKIVEESTSKAVHMPVTIGKVRLSILGIPAVQVDDITIGPALPGEPPLAAAKSVRIHVRFLPLFHSQVEIRSLDVETPHITLLTRRDKSSNFPAFSDSSQSKTAGPPALPLPITLRSLRISEGKLAILNEESNSQVILEGISQKLSLRLSSDLKNILTSGKLNIKNISFTPGAGKKPLTGVRLAFTHILSGDAAEGDLSLSRGDIEVNGLPLSLTGKISNWKNIAFTIETKKLGGSNLTLSGTVSNYLEKPVVALITSGNIRMDDLADALPAFRTSGLRGGASFNLSAAGTPSLPQSMEMNGSIALKALSLPPSRVLRNTLLINGSLRLSPQTITLENLAFQTGKSDFALNGRLEGYMNLLPSKERQPAFLKGALVSRLIDINDMVILDKKTPVLKPWDLEKPLKNLPVPPNLEADATLMLNTIIFGRLKADAVKGRLVMKNWILELSGLDLAAYEGKLAGKTVINFSNPDNVRYNGAFDLKKMNVEPFVSSFFGAGDNFRGLVSCSLAFSGAGMDSVSFLNNLKGAGSASIENGQFVNWDFTRKLGQTLRFLNFDTLNFGNASTTFSFENRRITTPDLLFRTQYGDMTVSGSTGYDATVNYDIAFKLNRAAANLATQNKLGDLGSIFSSGTVPQLYLTATGTLQSPSFRIDSSRTRKEVQDKLRNEAEKFLNKQNDKLREQGKKILDKLFR